MNTISAEYFARYNLEQDVPFEPYTNGIVHFNEISTASRGACRPAWEVLYNHYVMIKKEEAPWTTEYLNKSLNSFGGYEPGAGSWGEGSGHYDSLGWGSLLYHLEESDVAQISTVATSSAGAIATSASSSVPVAISSAVQTTLVPTAAPSPSKAYGLDLNSHGYTTGWHDSKHL